MHPATGEGGKTIMMPNSAQESDKEALISDWIVEYFCPYILNRFVDNAFHLDEFSRYLIDGLLGVIRNQEDVEDSKEAIFLALFAHLSNVQSPDSLPVDDEDFHDILNSFSFVLQCLSKLGSSSLQELQEIQEKTVLQAVYTFCRKDQYDCAEVVMENLSPMVQNMANVKSKMEAVLRAEQRPHPCLEKESFEGYMESVGHFMTFIYRTFRPPFLTSLAHAVITVPAQYSKRGDLSSKSLKKCEENEEILANNIEHEDQLSCVMERIRSQVTVKLTSVESRHMMERAEVKRKSRPDQSDTSETSIERTPKKTIQSHPALVVEHPRNGDDRRDTSDVRTHHPGNGHEQIRGDTSSALGEGSLALQYRKNRNRVNRHADLASAETSSGGEDSSRNSSHCYDSEQRNRLHTKERHSSGDSIYEDSFDEAYKSPAKRPKNQAVPRLRRSLSLNRKTRKKWTSSEEEEFYQAVQEHGVGKWAIIRCQLKTHRSNMQLKDKWRNMCEKYNKP